MLYNIIISSTKVDLYLYIQIYNVKQQIIFFFVLTFNEVYAPHKEELI